MVDKIRKALDRLTDKEKELVKGLLRKINNMPPFIPHIIGEAHGAGLDVKKLKGRNDIYRVRKGKIRIIYRIADGQLYLLTIEKRSDNTYRDF